MIRAAIAAFVVAIAFAAALALSGCAIFKSPEAKTVVHDVVNLALAECVQSSPSTDPSVVAEACKDYGPIVWAVLERLIAAKRAGMAKAGACKPAPTASFTPRVPACVYVVGYREAYVDSSEVTP